MDIALLLSAFGFGIRHGFDWDHIAAISDITTSEKSQGKALSLATAYAFGHAIVVVLLGTVIVLADFTIPDTVDTTMMYLIGGSLIALGIWVLVSVVVQGENFRLRSRWMIIREGAFKGVQKVKNSPTGRNIVIEHEHPHLHVNAMESHEHSHNNVHNLEPKEKKAHRHRHRHEFSVDGSSMEKSTAGGIGIIHGIGLETPTQIAIFVATTQSSGKVGGLFILGAWVTGLLIANSMIAIITVRTSSWLQQHLNTYRVIAAGIGLLSLVVGILVCIERDDLLPVF
jgi:high-affinity nickel-transport protein